MNNLILFLFSFLFYLLISTPYLHYPLHCHTMQYLLTHRSRESSSISRDYSGFFPFFPPLMKSDQLSLFLLSCQKKVHRIYKKRNIMPYNCSLSSVCVCLIVLRVVPCPSVPLRLCACQQSPLLLSPLSCYFCPVLM